MATDSPNDAQLNVRLPADLKTTIKEAAACRGQTVSEFAVLTLAETARAVIEQHQVTRLSNRDRDTFMALLDDVDARPNEALMAAADRYKKRA